MGVPTHIAVRRQVFGGDVGHALRATHTLHRIAQEARGGVGLTPTQFAVLLAATRVPGSDQSTIADLAALDRSSVSEVVRRLERQRRLTILPDEEDARKSRLFVAPEMTPAIRTYIERLKAADAELLAPLPEPRRAHMLRDLRHVAFEHGSRALEGSFAEAAEGVPVAETNSALGRLVRVCLQKYGVTWKQEPRLTASPVGQEAMRVLAARPGVSQSFLGKCLLLERASITGLMQRLSERELIRTEPSTVDRRRNRLFLTDTAERYLAATSQLQLDVDAALLEPISRDARSHLVRDLYLVTECAAAPQDASAAGAGSRAGAGATDVPPSGGAHWALSAIRSEI